MSKIDIEDYYRCPMLVHGTLGMDDLLGQIVRAQGHISDAHWRCSDLAEDAGVKEDIHVLYMLLNILMQRIITEMNDE